MPKPVIDKPFPMTWKERAQMAGALSFTLFIGIPALLFVLYCVISLLS